MSFQLKNDKLYAYADTETTGIDLKFDIIQIAIIVNFNGVEFTFNEHCKPSHYNNIEKALEVNGITINQLKKFQEPAALINSLEKWLKNFDQKLILCGYNISFDIRHLQSFFAKNGRSDVYTSFFEIGEHIDVLGLARAAKKSLGIANCKLGTVAERFGISFNAHDALADIRATKDVFLKLKEHLGDEDLPDRVFLSSEEGLRELPLLHVHSAYSLLDSCNHIEDWVKHAEEINSPAIAFPDHDWAVSLYSAMNSSKLKKKDDFVIVPAISLNVTANGECFRLNAYGSTSESYFALSKLASIREGVRKHPTGRESNTISLKTLIKNTSSDISFSSAGEDGIFGVFLKAPDKAKQIAYVIPNLYIELTAVNMFEYFCKEMGIARPYKESVLPSKNLMQDVNQLANSVANELELKKIITTASYYISQDDHDLHRVISSSYHKTKFFHSESRSYKAPQEVFAILESQLEGFDKDFYNQCYDNSMEIVEKARNFKVTFDYTLPKINIPENIQREHKGYNSQLAALLIEKVQEYGRWSDDPIYVERFVREMTVISKNPKLNFLPYFLMSADIGEFARSKGILQGLGRGSAGGCLISYYLKIIHIDPIKNDIPFERFLSNARINVNSYPDIDCLSGNTKISLAKGGVGMIADLAKLDPSDYPDLVSFNENTKEFIHQKPTLIFSKGIREVNEYVFDDGSSIVCTSDHRVLTDKGWETITNAEKNGSLIIDYGKVFVKSGREQDKD